MFAKPQFSFVVLICPMVTRIAHISPLPQSLPERLEVINQMRKVSL
jgi:hypothetical protein